MGESGTGLRAHLRRAHPLPEADAPVAAPGGAQGVADLAAERGRLRALATELAGEEVELRQREAELHALQERMALSLARALLRTAEEMGVPPPLDELALARARRYAAS